MVCRLDDVGRRLWPGRSQEQAGRRVYLIDGSVLSDTRLARRSSFDTLFILLHFPLCIPLWTITGTELFYFMVSTPT